MRFSDRTSNWIAGFGFGGVMGLLSGAWPTFAIVLLIAFVIPALRSRSPVAAIAGLLVGGPLFWLLLVGRAALACREFDERPGQECVGPDLFGWFVVAGVLLVVGILLTWRAVRRTA